MNPVADTTSYDPKLQRKGCICDALEKKKGFKKYCLEIG